MNKNNDYTTEELRKLAAERETQFNLGPVKTAELAHDLYAVDYDIFNNKPLITEKEKNSRLDKMVTLFARKGASFECFIVDGEEEWYDYGDGLVVGMNKGWAEQHLIKVKEYKVVVI